MSGSEVEMLVLHPLRLANTLYHLNSLGMNTPEALSTPLHQASSVTWVKLLQGQLLIVASSNAHQSTLSLWSVPALFQGGKQAAELTKCYLPGPVYRGVLDLQGNNAVFALELRSR
ncbi:uncharacterized protein PHACADRAFT_253725 [Phanerochaete carnosa HHB-10118-sp]|uniref:Uncharacterized protein n=1 Tax=Phanerochaete carnosa (strain HHB-10118-sp) TaxID=650164 RepID=K5X195_PHACS|nr:uncharacterized protein PHACADRAFT_253725 [Phanerochaete carnosa HHB-10118-sp]EKM56537.1 hypothetical protein PHACADRAFT_253725 [Phanerochaete carnosa HHB-10118-sp]